MFQGTEKEQEQEVAKKRTAEAKPRRTARRPRTQTKRSSRRTTTHRGDLVAVWVVRLRHMVVRHRCRILRNQLPQPVVVPIGVLRSLRVGVLRMRRLEVHTRARNLPLLGVADTIVEVG